MKLGSQIRPVPIDGPDVANKDYVNSVASGGVYALPEKWHQIGMTVGQPDTAMSTLVSQTFDDIQAIKAGSIVGLNVRCTANLSGGTVTATVTVNVTPGTLAVTVSSGSESGRLTQLTGVDTFSPGDEIGIILKTDGSYAPVTLDAEAWLEIT